MRILIVSQYYFPEQFQINEIAPELVKRGHSVTVLCGLPNYPQGKIYDGYTDISKQEETIDGVHIIRVKQQPRGKNPISLVLNYWSFVKAANKKVKVLDSDFDVVLGYQLSPITSMLPAVKYSKANGIPLILYVLDLWPVSGESHLPIKLALVMNWLNLVSRQIYTASNRILVTSRPFIKYLHEVNAVDVNKMSYLPQHADTAMLNMNLMSPSEGIVNFMYAGNLGAGSTLDVIVKAAVLLGKRQDYKIHFVGDGSCRTKLEKMVSDMGLSDNFVFHGNQPRTKMPEFYRMADALLITLRGNNAVGDTMPGKLQMYMTTGKPILGAINGAAKEVIEESECGKCVKAGDSAGLAKIMEDFIGHPENYKNCGENARNYFLENFTLEKYMDSLELELNNLAK